MCSCYIGNVLSAIGLLWYHVVNGAAKSPLVCEQGQQTNVIVCSCEQEPWSS